MLSIIYHYHMSTFSVSVIENDFLNMQYCIEKGGSVFFLMLPNITYYAHNLTFCEQSECEMSFFTM